MAAADIVLWVVDGADAEVVDTDIKACGTDKEVVSIFNKKDHPRFKQGAAWQRENTVVVSALTGEGMGGLKECIIRYINKREELYSEPLLLDERQAQLCRQAAKMLDASKDRCRSQEWELASLELRHAMNILAAITVQQDVGEAVLRKIFSEFCVGK